MVTTKEGRQRLSAIRRRCAQADEGSVGEFGSSAKIESPGSSASAGGRKSRVAELPRQCSVMWGSCVAGGQQTASYPPAIWIAWGGGQCEGSAWNPARQIVRNRSTSHASAAAIEDAHLTQEFPIFGACIARPPPNAHTTTDARWGPLLLATRSIAIHSRRSPRTLVMAETAASIPHSGTDALAPNLCIISDTSK
ncbi:hypothetical protein PaG_04005 [Moesziomyces aphidis]|uniref:Uncharacterized protein n=1 Tax=Moesziomyces aphidis TaxID=84754 RepID=W3VK65_MOEAP|nr:hypothetical protein PaG_04005 [Moesziomyces aphidis]